MWQLAVCESCKEATTFTIRIVKNQSFLYIGFTTKLEAVEQKQDMWEMASTSWLIDSWNKKLIECIKGGPFGREPIKEGSLITIEKDRSQCALRFLVDKAEPKDTYGQVYGWRKTNLSRADFDALVGCVWLKNKGDEVTIVTESEGMTSAQQ